MDFNIYMTGEVISFLYLWLSPNYHFPLILFKGPFLSKLY